MYEYVYGWIGKAIVAVSSRTPAAVIESVQASDTGDAVAVVVRGSEAVEAVLKTTWKTRSASCADSTRPRRSTSPPGRRNPSSPGSPRSPPGERPAHSPRDPGATATSVLTWGAASLRVESPLRLAAASPVKSDGYRKAERIEAPIQVENQGGEPASVTLTISLTDSYGREVWTQEARVEVGARGATASRRRRRSTAASPCTIACAP